MRLLCSLLASLVGTILLHSILNGQSIYAPSSVMPSLSIPVHLWWGGKDVRSATLRLYRLKDAEEILETKRQARELVWSKVVIRKPKEYSTIVRVPASQVGVYVLEMVAGKQTRSQTINVTRMVLVAKKSPKQILVFTADAKNGKPISGCSIKLFDEKGKLVKRGRTDEKGLFLTNWALENAKIIATAPDGSAAKMLIWSEMPERYIAYIYTDRPVYRPNQKVYFKGIVRKFENGEYLPVTDKQVRVVVRDPEDTEIVKLSLTTNRFGNFAGEVQLPKKASLGYYGIIATIDNEEYFAGFEVAEYRKPEFEVKVTTDKPHYIRGEKIRVSVKATYFFGAPVAEARVTYTVSASPIWWYPFGDEFESWYEPPQYYGEFIARNVTQLGKDGTVEFTVPTTLDPKRPSNRDMRYFIRCEVTDQSNRTVSGSASCSVFRAAFQIALSTDRYAYRTGETMTVQIKTTDIELKPLSANLHLALEREQWNAKERRHERVTVERQQVTTKDDGSATATFHLTKPGYYRIACWGRDEEGNLTSDATWIWVAAEGDFDYSYPTLELVADKKTYNVGEVAQILINSNQKGVWALVTVEGEEIYDAFIIPIEHRSSVLQLPITKRMRPNCYLHVGYVWEGNFISAHKIIVVPPKDKFLQVEVFSEKTVYQPRETVRYRIVTKDFEGKPVSAELSFALVDEAIFAMKADTTPDIRKFFFGGKPNWVNTEWGRVMVAKDIVALEKARKGMFPPSLLPAGVFQKVGETEVRRRFEDTAFWHPFLITDENGEASLEVPLPDNLTTWRATVRAVTLQTQVGSAVHKIRATKPLLIRLQLPRFFTQGDVSKILTVVHNNTDEPQKVNVGLKAKGASVSLSFVALSDTQNQVRPTTRLIASSNISLAPEPEIDQTATIPPHRSQTFTWWVSIPEFPSGGKATFTAAVVSESGLKDAVELSVPVRPRGVEVVQAKSGITETTAAMSFRLPEDAIRSASYLEIRLSPSLIGPMLGSLEYLVGYPYG